MTPTAGQHPAHLACGGWISSCVAVAATLGIADLLDGDTKSVDELADATGTLAPVLRRVLGALASYEIFERLDHDRYANSPGSRLLRTDDPASVRHFCMLAGGTYQEAFGDLLHTVRTGEPGFQHRFGSSIYECMEENGELASVYDQAMENLARPVAELVARSPDFATAKVVVDVGGGTGTMLCRLLEAHPSMRGLCVDRPKVCDRGAQMRQHLRDRIDFVPGDFFAEVPGGGDVYLLKNVLHNWNDASSLRILSAIHRAMDGLGRLLIIEPLRPAGDTALTSYNVLDDLCAAVICEQGMQPRTEAEMTDLLERGSFRLASVSRLAGEHVVITAHPRGMVER